ncbi:hypothetical protein L1887_15132 [Cichorium endivia]|nr:hypothetical protein L1887_15132 [Cichorium endivia]
MELTSSVTLINGPRLKQLSLPVDRIQALSAAMALTASMVKATLRRALIASQSKGTESSMGFSPAVIFNSATKSARKVETS